MSKWAELAEKIRVRDRRQVEDINSFYGGGPTIENRIALADGRAQDALVGVLAILAHLDELEHAPQRPLSEDGGESTAQSSAVACPTKEK